MTEEYFDDIENLINKVNNNNNDDNDDDDDRLQAEAEAETYIETKNQHQYQHQLQIELELTPELKQAGIVERFDFYAGTNAIHILLNHHYIRKSIVFSVDKKDWNKTHSIFEKQLKQKGVSKDHILQLADVLDNNYNTILSLGNGRGPNPQSRESGNGEQQQQEQEKDNGKKHKRRYATYKYSAKGADVLHEAILAAGQAAFIIYDKDQHKIKAVQYMEEATRMLKPPNSEEYPYEPYEFANVDELQLYMDRAANESIDSLYQKTKSIVRKYNDQDEHKLTLLAADIIWSYFQDKFSTTLLQS
jgi:hypothetical protein